MLRISQLPEVTNLQNQAAANQTQNQNSKPTGNVNMDASTVRSTSDDLNCESVLDLDPALDFVSAGA